jgi:hypothetical protein
MAFEMSSSKEMQACIRNCMECSAVCMNTAAFAVEHQHPAHVMLLLDCADICNTSANFMLRGSEQHHLTCGVCAELCQMCADECAKMQQPQFRGCADICRRCADTCRQMSHATA